MIKYLVRQQMHITGSFYSYFCQAILDIRGLVGHPQNWLEESLESPRTGSAHAMHIKPVAGTGVVGRGRCLMQCTEEERREPGRQSPVSHLPKG